MIRAKTNQVEQRPGHGLGLNRARQLQRTRWHHCHGPAQSRLRHCVPGRQKGGPHVTNRDCSSTGRIWRAIGAALGALAAQMVSRAWNPCTLSVWISHRDRDWFQSALLAAVGPVRVRNSTGFSHTTGPGRDRPRWRSAAVVNEFFRHVPVSYDPSGKSGTCP